MTERQLFDHVAAAYDAHRPDYPPQLFDALESAMGQPLLRAHVLDVGAGTGIATRALAGRGAEVVAVDPGPGVIGVLRARSTSRVSPVVGDGNALPIRDGFFDLVTYAQSWHWTDPERSLPEAARVLRPGGVFAAFWNILQAKELPWWEPFFVVCERLCPGYHRDMFEVEEAPDLPGAPLWRWLRRVEIPWTRELSVDDLVADYASHSYVAALGPDDRDTVLGVLRAGARGAHPDARVVLPYVTRTWVARR